MLPFDGKHLGSNPSILTKINASEVLEEEHWPSKSEIAGSNPVTCSRRLAMSGPMQKITHNSGSRGVWFISLALDARARWFESSLPDKTSKPY